MRSYLVLDIETVPDPNLPWDAAKDGFPPPPFHMVVALGVLWLDEALHFKKMGVFGEKKGAPGTAAPEARVLEEFARFVGDKRPHLVTYNGRTFDLPVLANRCLRHGVPFTAYYSDRDYRYRYSDLGHLDLADILTDHGAARMPKLAHVAKLVGMPGKLDVDGSMVDGLYEQGRIEEIRTYCLHDVVQTAFVFLRVELLRGRLSPDSYRERARELWDALEKEPRAEAVLEKADERRTLLLGEGEPES
jgi:predicted PolB exonuclease-like 3'-5' exonuclease